MNAVNEWMEGSLHITIHSHIRARAHPPKKIRKEVWHKRAPEMLSENAHHSFLFCSVFPDQTNAMIPPHVRSTARAFVWGRGTPPILPHSFFLYFFSPCSCDVLLLKNCRRRVAWHDTHDTTQIDPEVESCVSARAETSLFVRSYQTDRSQADMSIRQLCADHVATPCTSLCSCMFASVFHFPPFQAWPTTQAKNQQTKNDHNNTLHRQSCCQEVRKRNGKGISKSKMIKKNKVSLSTP